MKCIHKEGVHPSKWGTNGIGGVCVWCYGLPPMII
nr:MAG TPA: hypothetical protein [Caudoviricetes sp.]